jgi:hypothetical protein
LPGFTQVDKKMKNPYAMFFMSPVNNEQVEAFCKGLFTVEAIVFTALVIVECILIILNRDAELLEDVEENGEVRERETERLLTSR